MCSSHWLVASEHSDFLTPRHQLAAGHSWSAIAPFLHEPLRSLHPHLPWSKRSTRACFEVQIEVVEATINLPNHQVHASASSEDMYAAVDLLIDKLQRQIVKHKEKDERHH